MLSTEEALLRDAHAVAAGQQLRHRGEGERAAVLVVDEDASLLLARGDGEAPPALGS